MSITFLIFFLDIVFIMGFDVLPFMFPLLTSIVPRLNDSFLITFFRMKISSLWLWWESSLDEVTMQALETHLLRI